MLRDPDMCPGFCQAICGRFFALRVQWGVSGPSYLSRVRREELTFLEHVRHGMHFFSQEWARTQFLAENKSAGALHSSTLGQAYLLTESPGPAPFPGKSHLGGSP